MLHWEFFKGKKTIPMNTEFYILTTWMAIVFAYLLHPKPFWSLGKAMWQSFKKPAPMSDWRLVLTIWMLII